MYKTPFSFFVFYMNRLKPPADAGASKLLNSLPSNERLLTQVGNLAKLMSKLRSAQKSGSLMISLQARQFASDRKSSDCVKEEKIEVATPRISNTRIRRWYKNPSFLLRPTSFLCCLFFTCKYHISITIQEKSKLESKIVFRLSSACGFVQFLHTETYIFVL